MMAEADPFVRRVPDVVEQLGASLERMIATQMGAYPDAWPEADKREVAEQQLFGRMS